MLFLQDLEHRDAALEKLAVLLEDPDLRASKALLTPSLQQLKFVVLRNLARLLEDKSSKFCHGIAGHPAAQTTAGDEFLHRALECYIEASEIDSSDVVLYSRLAKVAERLGNLPLARYALNCGLLISPNHQILLEKLMGVCRALKDGSSAVGAARRLYTLNPDHPTAHGVLSQTGAAEKLPGVGADHQIHQAPDVRATAERPGQVIDKKSRPQGLMSITSGSLFGFAAALDAHAKDGGASGAAFVELVFDPPGSPEPEPEPLREPAQGAEGGGDIEEGSEQPASAGGDEEMAAVSPEKSARESGEAAGAAKPMEDTRPGLTGLGGVAEGHQRKRKHQGGAETRRSQRITTLQEKLEEGNVDGGPLDPSGGETAPGILPVNSISNTLREFFRFQHAGVKNEAGDPETPSPRVHTSDTPEEALVEEFLQALEPKPVTLVMRDFLAFVAHHATGKAISEAIKQLENAVNILSLATLSRSWESSSPPVNLFLAEVALDCLLRARRALPGNSRPWTGKDLDTAQLLKIFQNHIGAFLASSGHPLPPGEEAALSFSSKAELLIRYHWVSGRMYDYQKETGPSREHYLLCKSMLSPGSLQTGRPVVQLPWCACDGTVSQQTIDAKVKRHDRQMILARAANHGHVSDALFEELTVAVLGEHGGGHRLEEKHVAKLEDVQKLDATHLLYNVVAKRSSEKRDGDGTLVHIEMILAVQLLVTYFPLQADRWDGMSSADKKHLKNAAHSFIKCCEELDPPGVETIGRGVACLTNQLAVPAADLVQWICASVAATKRRPLNAKLQERNLSITILGTMIHLMGTMLYFRDRVQDAGLETFAAEVGEARVCEEIARIDSGIKSCSVLHELASAHCGCCFAEGRFLKHILSRLHSATGSLQRLSQARGIKLGMLGGPAALGEDGPERGAEDVGRLLESGLLHARTETAKCYNCLYHVDVGMDGMCDHTGTGRVELDSPEAAAGLYHHLSAHMATWEEKDLRLAAAPLRKVLKLFECPPADILESRNIRGFLDDPEFDERAFADGSCDLGGYGIHLSRPLDGTGLAEAGPARPGDYGPVYRGLYWDVIQAERRVEKGKSLENCQYSPGRILTDEGRSDVEEETALYLNDLHCNPWRFSSWLDLSRIYDDAKDLLQNDAAKEIGVSEWMERHVGAVLGTSFATYRRRSRRCLLVAHRLAPESEEVLELLGLCTYDALQNVPPMFDQISREPARDANWSLNVHLAFKFFSCASGLNPDDSTYPYFLSKLKEKVDFSDATAVLRLIARAVEIEPTALEPFYRLHAYRSKVLMTCFRRKAAAGGNADVRASLANTAAGILGCCFLEKTAAEAAALLEEGSEGALTDAFAAIHADCCAAMHYCLEIHKHFYPARYCLGRLLVAAGEVNGAQQVLSFCFKGRGGFGLNLWEEEAFRLPKSFRGVSDKVSEGDWKPGRPCRSVQSIGRDESSRKFVAKLRKIAVLYLLCSAQLALLRHAENLDGSEYVAYIEALSRFLRTNDYWQKCMADVAHFSVALLVNTLLCVMKIPRLSGTEAGAHSVGSYRADIQKAVAQNPSAANSILRLYSEISGGLDGASKGGWAHKMHSASQMHPGVSKMFSEGFEVLSVECPVSFEALEEFMAQTSQAYVAHLTSVKMVPELESLLSFFIKRTKLLKAAPQHVQRLFTDTYQGLFSHILSLVGEMGIAAGEERTFRHNELQVLHASCLLYKCPQLNSQNNAKSAEVLLLSAFGKLCPSVAGGLSSVEAVVQCVDNLLKQHSYRGARTL